MYHEDGISISGTYRSQKEPYQENCGGGGGGRISNPHSVEAVIATCGVWAGALCCKSKTPQVRFPRLFLVISWRSRLDLLDKIAGIIFIARQEIPRNIKPSPFLIISQHSRRPSCLTFELPKMVVRIDYTAPKLMPTSLSGSWR